MIQFVDDVIEIKIFHEFMILIIFVCYIFVNDESKRSQKMFKCLFMMFRKIIEILIEFFDRKRNIWSNVNCRVHDIFNCMLIIFLIDAFIVWFNRSKCFVFIHWKFCNFVFVNVHIESWKNVNEIMRLIHAKNLISSIANYFDVKNFIHFFQILDCKYFFEFFLHQFIRFIDFVAIFTSYTYINNMIFFWNDKKTWISENLHEI